MEQKELLQRIKESIVIKGKEFIRPKFIETNSSFIIFVGEMVFKVLKEEKGKEFCGIGRRYKWLHEELQINKEITPELYLGVIPVSMKGSKITIDFKCSGKALEYALYMRRVKAVRVIIPGIHLMDFNYNSRFLGGQRLKKFKRIFKKRLNQNPHPFA